MSLNLKIISDSPSVKNDAELQTSQSYMQYSECVIVVI